MSRAGPEPPTPASLAARTGMRPVPTATIRARVSGYLAATVSHTSHTLDLPLAG